MEVYQALSLMFKFGMFIIALLNYLKKEIDLPGQR
nr:putative holin-like toxin [Paenibacillus ihuae]